MSKAIEKIKAYAEELRAVRDEIEAITEEADRKTEALKARKDVLQTELIAGFNKEGLTSIKTEDGATYAKAIRKGIEVTNERTALEWAIARRYVSINKLAVKQCLEPLIKKGEQLPTGFEYKEVEYISVRLPKKDEA